MTPIKWPCDWNRPLSEEEREIVKRLDRAPKEEYRPQDEPMPLRREFDQE